MPDDGSPTTGSPAVENPATRSRVDWLRLCSWTIDLVIDGIGRVGAWMTLAMVLVGSYNTVARYVDGYRGQHLEPGETYIRFSSNALLEWQWYLFSLVFLLGAAYTLRQGAHVRVDLLYGRLSAKGKAWVDLLGGLLLLLPFSVFGLWVSWPSVLSSWRVKEMSPDSGGLQRYPIKSVILLGFALLVLQGLSEVMKQVIILRADPSAESEGGEA